MICPYYIAKGHKREEGAYDVPKQKKWPLTVQLITLTVKGHFIWFLGSIIIGYLAFYGFGDGVSKFDPMLYFRPIQYYKRSICIRNISLNHHQRLKYSQRSVFRQLLLSTYMLFLERGSNGGLLLCVNNLAQYNHKINMGNYIKHTNIPCAKHRKPA